MLSSNSVSFSCSRLCCNNNWLTDAVRIKGDKNNGFRNAIAPAAAAAAAIRDGFSRAGNCNGRDGVEKSLLIFKASLE